jgi:glycerophosphoryl diester phosphodiesterase
MPLYGSGQGLQRVPLRRGGGRTVAGAAAVTLVLAHRGAPGPWGENTVAAFVEARRLGADGVELDVRRSADGALVVHHDAEVPGVGPIARARVAELPEHVPLLAEALEACDGMVVNVEIKSDGDEALPLATAAALAEFGQVDRVVVSSFDVACLEAVRRAEPQITLGWLLGVGSNTAAAVARAAERGFEAVHPFVASVDADLVALAEGAGLDVRVWTVNADADLVAMAGLCVSAVITDRPAEALALVATQGPSPGATSS